MKPTIQKKLIIFEIILLLFILSRLLFVSYLNTKISLNTYPSILTTFLDRKIKKMKVDYRVIPDKYNTGYVSKPGVTVINQPGNYNGLYYKYGANNSLLCLDFYYNNQDTESIIFIEDTDFSSVKLAFYHFEEIDKPKIIIFNNCKFKSVTAPREDTQITTIFNNCSFNSFYGSNSIFNRCYFGESYADAIVPFRNVYVYNSYISNIAQKNTEKVIHTDGTQIYGHKNLDVENIHFENCRYETPNIPISDNKSYVNACIMLQLEYSSGKNISFKNCIINGGGFSIYAWSKNPKFDLSSVTFSDINTGCLKKYGDIYYRTSPGVTFDNITETDSLYIGSVWKDSNNKVHISVTNDTNQDRTLLIYTESGLQKFIIPACPLSSTIMENNIKFDDLPFDIDINTNQDSSFIVCYDATTNDLKQIRYVNWSHID